MMLISDSRGLLGQLFVVCQLRRPHIGERRFAILTALQGNFSPQYQRIRIGRQAGGFGLRGGAGLHFRSGARAQHGGNQRWQQPANRNG
jgi:hypothetical protein